VEIADFAGLSARVSLFSRSDDYTGAHLTNPTVPAAYTAPEPKAPIRLGRHVIVGAGSVILPGVEIGEGAAIGALSLVAKPLKAWTIYAGSPAKVVRARRRDILDAEIRLRAALEAGEAVSPVAGL
jgi:galactoside O-acetyltransferase